MDLPYFFVGINKIFPHKLITKPSCHRRSLNDTEKNDSGAPNRVTRCEKGDRKHQEHRRRGRTGNTDEQPGFLQSGRDI